MSEGFRFPCNIPAPDNRHLEPGDLEAARELGVFEWGQCHSFALALHELRGWALMGCGYVDPKTGADHVVAIAPDGLPVDVTGYYVRGDLAKELDPEDVREWGSHTGMFDLYVDEARPFAEALLTELGL